MPTPAGDTLAFHLYLPQMRLSVDQLVERAQVAEEAGFEGLAMMDHQAPPAALDQPMYEAVATAAWLLARTERLVVGHLVLCDAFRHPAVVARQAVTLDHASGGRFELGLGSGSLASELATFGFGAPSGPERTARLGESLEIITGLWSAEPFSFAGRYFSLEGACQRPAPLTRIPILVGGTGPRTVALVARYADWWNVPTYHARRREGREQAIGSAQVSVQELVTFVPAGARRDEVTAQADRRFGWMGPDGRVVGDADELVAHYRDLAGQGIRRVYTWFTDFADPATLRAFGSEVIAAVG